jgi:hypothetical protein
MRIAAIPPHEIAVYDDIIISKDMRMATIADNRRQHIELLSGRSDSHLVVIDIEAPANPLGDFTLSDRPVAEWLPWAEAQYAERVRRQALTGDDSVPIVNLNTNTGIFASAFGCPLVRHEGSNASARPVVRTAAEADALPQPRWQDTPALARHVELARLIVQRLGPDTPVGVPDIQSPFDIAALVWDKAELMVAMVEEPEAVERLVRKCEVLLTTFLDDYFRQFPSANASHCPGATWAPAGLGLWLSEDEVGAMSTRMFERFCLPSLTRLSERFGGISMHCCACADHQYAGFRRIPRLRALNRVYQQPGPGPAIRAFSGRTVLIPAWCGVDEVERQLALATPQTRFLFNLGALPDDKAKASVERARILCARHERAGCACACAG